MALSTSTRLGVGRPAVEKLASQQQASPKLHVEAWAEGPRVSQGEEVVPFAVAVACPSCPDNSPEPPGPGRVIRNMLGWSQLEKTARSFVWLFRSAYRGESLLSSLRAAGDWIKKGSCHTAWSVPWDSSCTCSYAYGRGPASGHVLESGVGHCWPVCGGLLHP